LAAFEGLSPALILSDISMEEMDGRTFIRAVRRAEPARGGGHAGFDRFLPKPCDSAALIAGAANLLCERS
jgi:DNA-binding response OmpR family regulator